MHFHGTEVLKPIPSYQIYKGTVFELVDQAVDFVMSKINRAVGTRAESNQAPVTYELPHLAVAEAIVNAITHRDYTSNASVQVMLFSDRLEVWNPGELPTALTIGELRLPHASIPRNPLIAEPMFLAHYAEKAGSGILDMFKLCAQANLPPPEFRQSGGQFIQTLNRDWLTEDVINSLSLNERQQKGLQHLKAAGQISSAEYQQLTGTSRQTATRDLYDLVKKKVVVSHGRGRGAHYLAARKMTHK
jgi:predicted HTH transcriptional regulator